MSSSAARGTVAWRALCVGALGGALLFAAPVSARGQVVAGRVLDAETGANVSGARVRLLNAVGIRMGEAITDSTGTFRIAGRGPGRYALVIEHLGYPEFRSPPFAVPYMETVSVEVRISRAAIPLAPITVVGRRRENYHAPTYEGLYARIEQLPRVGSNRIVMKNDVEFRSVSRARDLLDQFFFDVMRGGGLCVYWNGLGPVSRAFLDVRLDTHVADLEAIEVYDHFLMAPMAFRDPPPGSLATTCGSVIALWPLRPDLPGRGR